jgi:hypothetical protein
MMYLKTMKRLFSSLVFPHKRNRNMQPCMNKIQSSSEGHFFTDSPPQNTFTQFAVEPSTIM